MASCFCIPSSRGPSGEDGNSIFRLPSSKQGLYEDGISDEEGKGIVLGLKPCAFPHVVRDCARRRRQSSYTTNYVVKQCSSTQIPIPNTKKIFHNFLRDLSKESVKITIRPSSTNSGFNFPQSSVFYVYISQLSCHKTMNRTAGFIKLLG